MHQCATLLLLEKYITFENIISVSPEFCCHQRAVLLSFTMKQVAVLNGILALWLVHHHVALYTCQRGEILVTSYQWGAYCAQNG